MGYDVHITRKQEWSDESGPRITEEEWRAYVASDPEMVMTGVAEATNPKGETIRITDPLLTEWRKHSEGYIVWFSYFRGNIQVKNPDEECLTKMREIASKLNARLQGDDGEFYDELPNTRSQAKSSLGNRIAGWFRRPQRAQQIKTDHPALPFGVGDRVRDSWGNEHTVLEIDRSAEHGLGIIRTRRDDGTEHQHAVVAHGLAPIAKES